MELRKTHNMTSQQRQEQFGNQWYVVQTTAGGSNTIPTRQHLEVGEAHRARMHYNSTQRATATLRKHSDRETSLLLKKTRSIILRSERELWNNTFTLSTFLIKLHHAFKSLSDSVLALPFFLCMVVEVE